MKKMMKFALVALALSLVAPVMADEDEGSVGYTPVAVALWSPVQLPWGQGNWDVFGLDLGIFYTDVAKMYGYNFAAAGTCREDVIGLTTTAIFNYANSDVYGVRAGLGVNMCNGTVYGLEAGGFGYHRKIYGADIEFLGTMQEEACGLLIGGIVNLTEKETSGCTIAIGVNLAPKAYGAQIAGVFNQTEELHGCQIGLVNYARECPCGFQIGVVNIIMDNQVKVLPLVNGYF